MNNVALHIDFLPSFMISSMFSH